MKGAGKLDHVPLCDIMVGRSRSRGYYIMDREEVKFLSVLGWTRETIRFFKNDLNARKFIRKNLK